MPVKDEFSSEIGRLVDRVDRLTDNVEREIESGINRWGSTLVAVDVIDHTEELEMVADIPGFEKNDIKVTGNEDSVTISVESGHEEKQKDEDYYRRERSMRSIKRTVNLSTEVDIENATSIYQNGVLRIRLPKLEPETERDATPIKIE